MVTLDGHFEHAAHYDTIQVERETKFKRSFLQLVLVEACSKVSDGQHVHYVSAAVKIHALICYKHFCRLTVDEPTLISVISLKVHHKRGDRNCNKPRE